MRPSWLHDAVAAAEPGATVVVPVGSHALPAPLIIGAAAAEAL